MKPSECLVAQLSKDQKVILLIAKGDRSIVVLGSSAPISARKGEHVSSFSVQPVDWKSALIAVMMYGSQGKSPCFFLEIRWKSEHRKDVPYIDLENEFVPGADRLAQIYPNDRIVEIRINDRIFTTREKVGPDEVEHYRKIADADAICQYLIGDITLAEFVILSSGFEIQSDQT